MFGSALFLLKREPGSGRSGLPVSPGAKRMHHVLRFELFSFICIIIINGAAGTAAHIRLPEGVYL